jgi:hypothetical protein
MYSNCLYNLEAFAHKNNFQQPLKIVFTYVKTIYFTFFTYTYVYVYVITIKLTLCLQLD